MTKEAEKMVCASENLRLILSDVTAGLREIFGEKLENVILYGSYARSLIHI